MKAIHADVLLQFPTATPGEDLAQTVDAFLRPLEAKNRALQTLRAYRGDLTQFAAFLADTNVVATTIAAVRRADVSEYLSHLHRQGLSGVTLARKLAALREFFRYGIAHELIAKSPVEGMEAPRRERRERPYLVEDDYTKLLGKASGKPRDVAILQVFLQTGIRVSELVALRVADVDFPRQLLYVRQGKGMSDRSIELHSRAAEAVKSYLDSETRKASLCPTLFLSRYGEGMTSRAVEKLITRYARRAGLYPACHLPHSAAHVRQLQSLRRCGRLPAAGLDGPPEPGNDAAVFVKSSTAPERAQGHGGDGVMKPYRFTRPPKALRKARLDNLALVHDRKAVTP